jgi:hypothetical protein
MILLNDVIEAHRAYVRGSDGRPVTDLLMVSIDISDVTFR